MTAPTEPEVPVENKLGELAVLSGKATSEQIEACLAMQRELRAQGLRKPIGGLMLEQGLLDRAALEHLLAAQQTMRELEEEATVPPRAALAELTERENNLLGEVLISHGLLDQPLLEKCQRIQHAYARRGIEKKIGEIIIETTAIERSAMEQALAAGPLKSRPEAHARNPARVRVDGDQEQAFLDAAARRRVLDSDQLARLTALRASLAELGVERWVGALAQELALVDESRIRKLETQVSRQSSREPSWRALPLVSLTPEECQQLRRFAVRSGAVAKPVWGVIRRAQKLYAEAGIERQEEEILVELQCLTPGQVSLALREQGRTDKLTRGYHRTDLPGGARGAAARFRIEVVRCPQTAAIGKIACFEEGAFIIGRVAPSGLALPDPQVTRNHARVSVEDGTVFLTDLGSENGVQVGGRQIERVALVSGQSFRIGQSVLQFLDTQASAAEAPHPDALVGMPSPPLVEEDDDLEEEVEPLEVLELFDTAAVEAISDEEQAGEEDTVVFGDGAGSRDMERIRSVFQEFYEQEERWARPGTVASGPARPELADGGLHQPLASRRPGAPRGLLLAAASVVIVTLVGGGGLLAYTLQPPPPRQSAEALTDEPSGPVTIGPRESRQERDRREQRIEALLGGPARRASAKRRQAPRAMPERRVPRPAGYLRVVGDQLLFHLAGRAGAVYRAELWLGERVRQMTVTAGTQGRVRGTASLEGLAPGRYTLRLLDGRGRRAIPDQAFLRPGPIDPEQVRAHPRLFPPIRHSRGINWRFGVRFTRLEPWMRGQILLSLAMVEPVPLLLDRRVLEVRGEAGARQYTEALRLQPYGLADPPKGRYRLTVQLMSGHRMAQVELRVESTVELKRLRGLQREAFGKLVALAIEVLEQYPREAPPNPSGLAGLRAERRAAERRIGLPLTLCHGCRERLERALAVEGSAESCKDRLLALTAARRHTAAGCQGEAR